MLRTTKSRHSASVIALVILGYAGTSRTSIAQTEPPAEEKLSAEGVLEEITVTARKRAESLQDVPLSVVAISGEDLERRSIENLADLGQGTPNFTFSQTYNGGSTAGVAFIRGVGQRDSHSAYDPAVGLYVDGVYMGRMYGNNLDMLELERIEVLRGPQGTLFGKNTSGGAINIITKRPDASAGATSGRIQLTAGERNRVDVMGSVNLPLIADRLALQLAGSRLKQDGYGKRVDGQDMASTDRQAARAQLLFQPTERFSALLSADWLDFDETNASYKLLDTNPLAGPVAAYNAAIDPDYNDSWVSSRDYFYSGTGPNSSRGTIAGAALTLAYDVSWATLKSITSYRESDVHTDVDPDGAPIVIINKFERADQEQFSQELQVTGSAFDERLEWVFGAYYFHEKVISTDSFNLVPVLFGGTRDFSRFIPVENDSIAAYGQGNYKMTDKLRLTVGLRHTQDKKDISSTQFNFLGATQFTTPLGEHDSDAWSPRLGLDYQWTPQVMTYVSAANGAKNGGFNGRVGRLSDFTEFDDEAVWTYEMGLRSDLFDGHVRLNATVFYSDYRDLQVTISGSTNNNGVPAPFSRVTNIPESVIKGAELELIVAAAPGLTFSGGLGLTDAQYAVLPTDAQFVADNLIHRSNEFPNVPEVSYTLGAEYATNLTSHLDLTARIDYSHRTRTEFTTENAPLISQPGYGLVNARLTFEHAQSAVAVSLFGTNLTDETYFVAGGDDANRPNPGLGFAIVNQGRPREWGVSLQKRF